MVKTANKPLALAALCLGVALTLGCDGSPKESEASPPALAQGAASPSTAGAALDGGASNLASQLPALPQGLPVSDAIARLEDSGYVLGAGITEFGQGPENGAYLEAWSPTTRPRALLLRLQVVDSRFEVKTVEADPPEALWHSLLPEASLKGAQSAASKAAEGFAGEGAVELLPTGPDGQRWQGEGGWQIVLAPGEESELIGPKGGGKLPLRGRWGEADHVQQLFVSPDGLKLAVVERLHHSGLHVSHPLILNPDTKTYNTTTQEGP